MAQRAVKAFAPFVEPGTADAVLFEVIQKFEDVARLIGLPL